MFHTSLRFLPLLLAALLLLSVFPVPAAAGTSGACGENLKWTLDADGLLTVSGTGDMADYNDYDRLSPFFGNPDILSVSIGAGVTGVGRYAFLKCVNLTSVKVASGAKRIGAAAFYGCRKLKEITLPAGVNEIGREAFARTAWFESLRDGVAYAGKVAYAYVGKMPENTALKLEDGTRGVADCAFQNCAGLSAVTVPAGAEKIGANAFRGCENLQTVSLPKSLFSVGLGAFADCFAPDVYFAGTQKEWSGVKIAGENEILRPETVFFGADHLHSWEKDPVVAAAPSCTEKGCVIRTCSVCGAAAVKNSLVPHKDADKDAVCDVCGGALKNVFSLRPVGVENGTLTVALTAKNSPQLIAADLTVQYDPAALAFLSAEDGGDALAADAEGNLFLSEMNGSVSGTLRCSLLFAGDLRASGISSGSFVLSVFRFQILDPSAHGTKLSLQAVNAGGAEMSAAPEITVPLAHTYGDTVLTRAATCAKEGIRTCGCTVCGAAKAETVAKIPHTWNGGAVTKEPTVSETGVREFTCTVCGKKRTESIDKLPDTAPAFTPGDVNGDGKVTAADARFALRRAVGLESYEPGSVKFLACDVNGDGKVTAADARKILRAAVGLEKLK